MRTRSRENRPHLEERGVVGHLFVDGLVRASCRRIGRGSGDSIVLPSTLGAFRPGRVGLLPDPPRPAEEAMSEANVPAQHAPAGQEPRVSSPHVHASGTGHPSGPAAQGATPPGGLTARQPDARSLPNSSS